MPFRTVSAVSGCEADFEVIRNEKAGNHRVDYESMDGGDRAVWFGDDEIDVARVNSAASIGTSNGDLDVLVDL